MDGNLIIRNLLEWERHQRELLRIESEELCFADLPRSKTKARRESISERRQLLNDFHKALGLEEPIPEAEVRIIPDRRKAV